MNDKNYTALDSQMIKDVNFLVYNETYMIGRGDATEYAKRLIQAGQVILGIEGFYYDGENIAPDMNCIVDFDETSNEGTVADILNAVLTPNVNFVEFTLK